MPVVNGKSESLYHYDPARARVGNVASDGPRKCVECPGSVRIPRKPLVRRRVNLGKRNLSWMLWPQSRCGGLNGAAALQIRVSAAPRRASEGPKLRSSDASKVQNSEAPKLRATESCHLPVTSGTDRALAGFQASSRAARRRRRSDADPSCLLDAWESQQLC